jgi:large subunit ribosomal protein L10
MSKVIKQMEMDALRDAFKDVRDLVVLSITGLDAQANHGFRSTLRKKHVHVKVVKNTLTRRVFGELGIRLGDDSPVWAGPTALAWGTSSVAELSRAIDDELKNAKTAARYKDKVTVKGAVVEGGPIPFEQALRMPTRTEAIANVLAAVLGPAGAIAGCLTGPAAQVAGQIQTLGERKEEAAPAGQPA